MNRLVFALVLVLALGASAPTARAQSPEGCRPVVVSHDHCERCCLCRPGHWEWRWERVCVEPGRWECYPVTVRTGRWVRDGVQLTWSGSEEVIWQVREVPARHAWVHVRTWVPDWWNCRPCICHLPPPSPWPCRER
ncbi:MAG: hypothetical protein HY722_13000 [Planctomycetes bacterium]|nr:hypothetical protein [Planctomycetota bacterium]